MSTKSTIYDVSVLYKMDDKASSALLELGRNADNAEKKTMGLKEALLGIGAVVGVGRLWDAGKESFVKFNSEIEQSKLGIAAVTKLFNENMTFEQASARSDMFFDHYQKVAKQSTGTTMDFVNMHKALAPALEQAGASIADMKKIVAGNVTTAPIAGYNSEMASLEIKQMFMGVIGGKDRYANMLIAAGHMTVAEFNAKAKKDPKFVLDFLSKTFDNDGLATARKKMEHTMDGAVSTLKDNIEIGLGRAGKPLFDAIRDSINSINDWIDKHPKEIEEWVNRIGKTLMDGFGAVKGAIKWVVEHKTELMAIAGAFTVLKGMSILGGGLVGGLNDFAGSIIGLKDASLASSKGLLSFAGNLTSVVGVLGTFYVALRALADYIDHIHEGKVKDQAENNAMMNVFNNAAKGLGTAHGMEHAKVNGRFSPEMQRMGQGEVNALLAPMVDHIKEWGAFTKDAKVDWQKFSAKIQDINLDPAAAAELGPMVDEAFKRFAADGSIWSRLGLLREGQFDDESKRKKANKTNVNVTIHKVEVASPDPDRFAFGLDKAFKKLAQNPTSARDTLRGGF